jgi:hypothetical protein
MGTVADDQQRLAELGSRYQDLAEQVTTVGYIATGSVVERWTQCAHPGCHCHADPPRRHGPYWQWTTKKDGKTITKRLTAQEAPLYREWAANSRQLRAIATQAQAILIKQTKV